jgi:hypothetical protein
VIGAEPRVAIKRPFGWGLLHVLDRRTHPVPDVVADSIVTASDEGLAIIVHHAQDTPLDGFEPHEVVPPAEVEVRIYVDTQGPNTRVVEADISVPSGTLNVGDAEQEETLDIGVGRWHVQVVCTPWQHADEVELWFHRRRRRAREQPVLSGSQHAELVAFRVGEHHMTLFRALTDVDMPGAKSDRPRHGLLLVLERRARQVEVHLVLAGLLRLGRNKSKPEPGVIARQERYAVLRVVGHLPAQDAGPEARETDRVVRIKTQREELRSHRSPHLRSADSRPLTAARPTCP